MRRRILRQDGGTWVSDLLSVFQSCRLQQLDPISYLTAVMPRLITGDTDPLRLTPASYAATRRRVG